VRSGVSRNRSFSGLQLLGRTTRRWHARKTHHGPIVSHAAATDSCLGPIYLRFEIAVSAPVGPREARTDSWARKVRYRASGPRKPKSAGPTEVAASPWLAFTVPRFMAKTGVVPKKKRGPAPTGKGLQVGERWHPSELAAIDAWIASSSDKTLTRAHAIRRLVALGLKAKKQGRRSSEGQQLRARQMAANAIDEMADTTAEPNEQASRKKRLLKGPKEFQTARVDQLNRKT
jgi:hypothetical protein